MPQTDPLKPDRGRSVLPSGGFDHLLQRSTARYGSTPDIEKAEEYTDDKAEFTEHQRHVFCVFSGEGVNRLRSYLNSQPDIHDTEGTMYDDREVEDIETDQQVAGLMQVTGLNDDDDEDMDEVDGGDGSQYEGEGEV